MAEITPAALDVIRAALMKAPQQCLFHGQDWDRLGFDYGEPRCESCRQPWRVVRALAEVDQIAREAA